GPRRDARENFELLDGRVREREHAVRVARLVAVFEEAVLLEHPEVEAHAEGAGRARARVDDMDAADRTGDGVVAEETPTTRGILVVEDPALAGASRGLLLDRGLGRRGLRGGGLRGGGLGGLPERIVLGGFRGLGAGGALPEGVVVRGDRRGRGLRGGATEVVVEVVLSGDGAREAEDEGSEDEDGQLSPRRSHQAWLHVSGDSGAPTRSARDGIPP